MCTILNIDQNMCEYIVKTATTLTHLLDQSFKYPLTYTVMSQPHFISQKSLYMENIADAPLFYKPVNFLFKFN